MGHADKYKEETKICSNRAAMRWTLNVMLFNLSDVLLIHTEHKEVQDLWVYSFSFNKSGIVLGVILECSF